MDIRLGNVKLSKTRLRSSFKSEICKDSSKAVEARDVPPRGISPWSVETTVLLEQETIVDSSIRKGGGTLQEEKTHQRRTEEETERLSTPSPVGLPVEEKLQQRKEEAPQNNTSGEHCIMLTEDAINRPGTRADEIPPNKHNTRKTIDCFAETIGCLY